MSDRLSTAEVSDALGIPQPTIKHWLGQLPIPAEKDGAGRWRFSDDALEVLKTVKALRDEDRTFNTIRRVIGEPATSASQSAMSDERQADEPQLSPDERPSAVDERALAETVSATVMPRMLEALAAQNEIAEKYARAAHQIGTLEATIKAIEADRDRVTAERDHALRERDDARALLAAPKEPVRPWWKLW